MAKDESDRVNLGCVRSDRMGVAKTRHELNAEDEDNAEGNDADNNDRFVGACDSGGGSSGGGGGSRGGGSGVGGSLC